MFFGLNGLAADVKVFHQYWALCSQLSTISTTRFLEVSDASPDTWTSVLNEIHQHDPGNAATRLKHRPSRFGGRDIAAVAATTPRSATA
eukprot:2701237-Pyramimonas_sp.AAC.1